ncbi:hypothetical protein HDU96_001115 [Phlyctochytrium bullatum]|nr:hypothetical protein HDU96_001115 [Phlyctochytrium bullatum]
MGLPLLVKFSDRSPSFACSLFIFSIVVVWSHRDQALAIYYMLFLGNALLIVRVLLGMNSTFMNNTKLVSSNHITNLAFARDTVSIMRSFPLIYLMVANVKVYLLVKWKDVGDAINIAATTAVLWACINVPWYVTVQLGRATGDPEIRALGALLVCITFVVYTILAISSEFMSIKMIWEIALSRDSRPFHWILNVSEMFLYISIVSFAMGNGARVLQYMVNKGLVVGPMYQQIISVFSGDISEAPFMLAMTFSMVVLARGLSKSEISFLKFYGAFSYGMGSDVVLARAAQGSFSAEDRTTMRSSVQPASALSSLVVPSHPAAERKLSGACEGTMGSSSLAVPSTRVSERKASNAWEGPVRVSSVVLPSKPVIESGASGALAASTLAVPPKLGSERRKSAAPEGEASAGGRLM